MVAGASVGPLPKTQEVRALGAPDFLLRWR